MICKRVIQYVLQECQSTADTQSSSSQPHLASGFKIARVVDVGCFKQVNLMNYMRFVCIPKKEAFLASRGVSRQLLSIERLSCCRVKSGVDQE
jgi:hypothetical protein